MNRPAPLLQRYNYTEHWMLTIGWESFGIRATMGKLDRNGIYHENWPCVFILWKHRRIG